MNQALKVFDQAMKRGAYLLLLDEELNNPEESDRRLNVCKSNSGGCYDEERDKCKYCHCYMMAKTLMLKHKNPKKLGRIEITHCPKANWGRGQGENGENTELEIANYYRNLDGQELLTN
jgi:hypothetical protein